MIRPIKEYKSYFDAITTNGKIPLNMGPLQADLHITYRCNLKCVMCDLPSWSKKYYEMNTKEIYKVIDSLVACGIKEIIISGGEPYVRNDIDLIIEYLGEKKVNKTIQTNGTLLNKKRIRLLVKHKYNVSLSIDGSNKKIHDEIRGIDGAFNKTFKNLLLLKKISNNQLDIEVNFVIQHKNLKDILKHYQLMKNLRIRATYCLPANFVDFTDKDIKIMSFIGKKIKKIDGSIKYKIKYFNELSKNPENGEKFKKGLTSSWLFNKENIPCLILGDSFIINPDGLVSPCLYSLPRAESMGNVLKEDILEIWHSKKYNHFRKNLMSINFDFGFCNENCKCCDKYFELKEIYDEIK